MRFSLGEAHAGELVLPIPNRKHELLDRWGIGVMRLDGLYRLEESIMRPEICAMICSVFRLPNNEKIRQSRMRLISISSYSPLRDTICGTRDRPLELVRLLRCRVHVPDHAREMIASYSQGSLKTRHSSKNFTTPGA